jgi:hypothetical protein
VRLLAYRNKANAYDVGVQTGVFPSGLPCIGFVTLMVAAPIKTQYDHLARFAV